MSLDVDLAMVEKEIGKKRAGAVAEFVRLVEHKKYREARKYLEKYKQNQQDIRRYALIYLRELAHSSL